MDGEAGEAPSGIDGRNLTAFIVTVVIVIAVFALLPTGLISMYEELHGQQLSLVLAFAVITIVLLVKPNGLFGRAEVSRV